MPLLPIATSAVDYLPAATELTVPLMNGKAEYICTLVGESSWTSTSTIVAPLSAEGVPAVKPSSMPASVVPVIIPAPLSAEGYTPTITGLSLISSAPLSAEI